MEDWSSALESTPLTHPKALGYTNKHPGEMWQMRLEKGQNTGTSVDFKSYQDTLLCRRYHRVHN